MHSPAEAKAYAQELYLLMRYADVSDANLYYGNMRFDVNVSVSKDESLGTRTETKNLNSFRSVEKAADFEIKRQIELLERGQKIDQETRGWDDAKQKTLSQRGKEEAHDYRYMPDPDLPPVELSQDYIAAIEESVPVLPAEWRTRLSALGLDNSQTAILIEAEVDNPEISYLGLIEAELADKVKAKQLANWLVNVEIPLRADEETTLELKDAERPTMYNAVFELVAANKLSSTNAKALLGDLLALPSLPSNTEKLAETKGYLQVSDSGAIEKIVKDVLDANPKAVEDLKAGQDKVIGFLVGQVMKASKGQANPELAKRLIKKVIG
jgi:aspartyl-tRNA(Asn)/glutamyl-tRNA(Gln) amidotransferase subunit B